MTTKTYLKPKVALAKPENDPHKNSSCKESERLPPNGISQCNYRLQSLSILATLNQFFETTITTLIDSNYLSKLYDHCALKGLAQAKIIKKSVILFWLLSMTI